MGSGGSTRFLRLVSFLLAALITSFLVSPGRAQADLEILEHEVDYRFGETLTIEARLARDRTYSQVTLFFRPDGQYPTYSTSVPASFTGRVRLDHDLTEKPLPPFSHVHYWFQAEDKDGRTFTSASLTFTYLDDRFRWREISDPPFRVHWYEGDLDLAQRVMDTAQISWRQLDELFAGAGNEQREKITRISMLEEEGMDIYVYASAVDLRTALASGGPAWVAGHADPDFGVVMVSVPPGPEQILEIERQVPHELAHIRLFHWTELGYHSLPIWLNEGLASVNELYPNSNNPLLLENAFEQESLIPMADLCVRFPSGASEVLLAYAQSASFTRYLNQQYGNSGVLRLVAEYADGKSCERGAEVALGMPLSEVEREWRQAEFAENPLTDLLPWAAYALAFLIPLPVVAYFLRRLSDQQEGTIKIHERPQ